MSPSFMLESNDSGAAIDTSAPEIASCSECVRSMNSEGPKKALRVDIVFEIEPIFWLTNLSTVSY